MRARIVTVTILVLTAIGVAGTGLAQKAGKQKAPKPKVEATSPGNSDLAAVIAAVNLR